MLISKAFTSFVWEGGCNPAIGSVRPRLHQFEEEIRLQLHSLGANTDYDGDEKREDRELL